MAGVQKRSFGPSYPPYSPQRPVSQPSPTPPGVQNAYNTYGTAARQSGQDYTDIMSKYKDVYGAAGDQNNGLRNFNFKATAPTYQTTPEYTSALSNLTNLSQTGGYSPEDIANIRARAISPIRSVYANANRNLSRQRALGGGYSPNFAAATAKMAREVGGQLSDATTNAEAGIAQNVAQNKIGTSGQLASLTAGEQNQRNDFAQRAAEFTKSQDMARLENEQRMYEFPIQSRLSALGGMSSLYGSTPGLTSFTGRQALDTAELQDRINNNRSNRKFQAFNAVQ